jgi:hypothetical protein
MIGEVTIQYKYFRRPSGVSENAPFLLHPSQKSWVVRNGMRHPTVAVRRRHRDKMNEFNIFATV